MPSWKVINMTEFAMNVEQIEAQKVDTENDLVDIARVVHWRYVAVDAEKNESSNAYGSVALGDADPEKFVDFDKLKKGDVEKWVWAVLEEREDATKEQMQEMLQAQIDKQANPPTENKLPAGWS